MEGFPCFAVSPQVLGHPLWGPVNHTAPLPEAWPMQKKRVAMEPPVPTKGSFTEERLNLFPQPPLAEAELQTPGDSTDRLNI